MLTSRIGPAAHAALVLAALVLPLYAQKPAATDRNRAPLKVCLVSGSAEYNSDESLAAFQKHLEANYNAVCSRAFAKDKGDDLPGVEALDTCDVMVLFTRRLTLPPEQMGRVKKYVDAGRPIVGMRTASHAFQNWQPEVKAFDHEVLGGSYEGHYGKDELAQVRFAEKGRAHPVLAGVKPFTTMGKLYKNANLAPDVTVLLTGATKDFSEPVAWVRAHKGGRIFYTSLGVPEDFKNENFRRLLVNAVFWAANKPPAKKP